MATAPLLIDADEYKSVKSITTTTSDDILEELCAASSQLVKTYCNNTFVDHFSNTAPRSNKTETITLSYPSHILQLQETPLRNIVSIQERERIGEAYKALTANKDFLVDFETDTIYRVQSSVYKNWGEGPSSVIIIYTAGYDNFTATTNPLPRDLRLAVIDLVTYYFKDQTKSRQTLAGASIQNETSTSQRNNVSFPDHIKRVLDLYKNY